MSATDSRSQPSTGEPQFPEMALQQARELARYYRDHDPPKPYTAGVLADCVSRMETLEAALRTAIKAAALPQSSGGAER